MRNTAGTREKHVKQSRNQNRHATAQVVSYQVRQTAPSLLQQMLHTVWTKQLEDDDLELLDVSLYHLFHNLNMLLQEILPQLAEISAKADQPMQSIRSRQVLRHHLWAWLSEIKHRLERIEPLCQISTITLAHLLIAIDTNESTTLQKSHQQILFSRTHQSDQRAQKLTTEETAYYIQGLQIWQELNAQQCKIQAFSQLFSDLHTSYTYLVQMDTALFQIYQSAQIIFSSILRASEKTTPMPKATMLLLLNLQQHIDNLQLQIETALTPLRVLLKHYALLVEMS